MASADLVELDGDVELLTDTLDACFEPLGAVGAPCDPAVVQCAGPGVEHE